MSFTLKEYERGLKAAKGVVDRAVKQYAAAYSIWFDHMREEEAKKKKKSSKSK